MPLPLLQNVSMYLVCLVLSYTLQRWVVQGQQSCLPTAWSGWAQLTYWISVQKRSWCLCILTERNKSRSCFWSLLALNYWWISNLNYCFPGPRKLSAWTSGGTARAGMACHECYRNSCLTAGFLVHQCLRQASKSMVSKYVLSISMSSILIWWPRFLHLVTQLFTRITRSHTSKSSATRKASGNAMDEEVPIVWGQSQGWDISSGGLFLSLWLVFLACCALDLLGCRASVLGIAFGPVYTGNLIWKVSGIVTNRSFESSWKRHEAEPRWLECEPMYLILCRNWESGMIKEKLCKAELPSPYEALPFCPSPPPKGGGGAKWQSFV